ncbi:hypothetical protein [Streptomyces purpurascens]|uniref:hypothetical protein n=1 Tax=Streptomyces purpurascens TaxID=1924 RepID=UPI0016735FDF|nr:hypothetical protein [Streptomyces purpurascens]MCE7051886.1 hypothetical protein [Streptomyces purpurascens]GHA59292.1 hypothetical protein GCM10010303_83710 [Streptomyces purpurascens]
MTKIFSRAIGTAAVAGAALIAAAVPASANTIGDNVGALLIGSQNQGANAGNDGSTSSHGSSNGNTLANNIADQSNVALVNTAKVAEGALVTA